MYLGVTVSHNLSWTLHIQEICKKARRVRGMIYNSISKNTNDSLITLKLYTALVCPHLQYAAQVWNPLSTEGCPVFREGIKVCTAIRAVGSISKMEQPVAIIIDERERANLVVRTA